MDCKFLLLLDQLVLDGLVFAYELLLHLLIVLLDLFVAREDVLVQAGFLLAVMIFQKSPFGFEALLETVEVATVGQVTRALWEVWGKFRPSM